MSHMLRNLCTYESVALIDNDFMRLFKNNFASHFERLTDFMDFEASMKLCARFKI